MVNVKSELLYCATIIFQLLGTVQYLFHYHALGPFSLFFSTTCGVRYCTVSHRTVSLQNAKIDWT